MVHGALSLRACFSQLKNMYLENYKSNFWLFSQHRITLLVLNQVWLSIPPFQSQLGYWMAVTFTHWAGEHHQNCTEVFVTLLTYHDSDSLCVVAESSSVCLGYTGRYYWNLRSDNIKEKSRETKKWTRARSSTNLYSGSELCNLWICHLLIFIPDTIHPWERAFKKQIINP